jgi:hypothetical protein
VKFEKYRRFSAKTRGPAGLTDIDPVDSIRSVGSRSNGWRWRLAYTAAAIRSGSPDPDLTAENARVRKRRRASADGGGRRRTRRCASILSWGTRFQVLFASEGSARDGEAIWGGASG